MKRCLKIALIRKPLDAPAKVDILRRSDRVGGLLLLLLLILVVLVEEENGRLRR